MSNTGSGKLPEVSSELLSEPADQVPDAEHQPARARATARNQAMNWLARREYADGELRTRLASRDYTPEEIETAVVGLVADGLVSDERFAEAFVTSRIRMGKGPVRIRTELNQRGVSAELISLHVDQSGIAWGNLAGEVRYRKFGAKIPADFKEKARQMRFLEYRGFNGEHIRTALGEDFD